MIWAHCLTANIILWVCFAEVKLWDPPLSCLISAQINCQVRPPEPTDRHNIIRHSDLPPCCWTHLKRCWEHIISTVPHPRAVFAAAALCCVLWKVMMTEGTRPTALVRHTDRLAETDRSLSDSDSDDLVCQWGIYLLLLKQTHSCSSTRWRPHLVSSLGTIMVLTSTPPSPNNRPKGCLDLSGQGKKILIHYCFIMADFVHLFA